MFEDRQSAGFLLAQKLEKFANLKNVLALGLARGGVVVAKVIATYLNIPLDTLVVKKIGAPGSPELAVGGAAPNNTIFWNKNLIKTLDISEEEKNQLEKAKQKEREEQERTIRGDKPLEISGKTVILVDDGVATGASVIAAFLFLKKEKVKKVILAVPVVARDTLRDIKKYFDMIVVLRVESEFHAVGQFYQNFPQVENDEVVEALRG